MVAFWSCAHSVTCQLLLSIALTTTGSDAVPLTEPNEQASASPDTISCDVVVIGGGSSGTYAAVRLQELGKSFVVIEKRKVLGGHTNTYHDPATGGTYDYGVQVYHNNSLVKDYFGKFNIPLTGATFGENTTYVDFRTGKTVPFTDPARNQTALGIALQKYAELQAKYPGLANGWDVPEPVPAELLMPFGEFVQKYSLEAMAYLVASQAQGFGNFYKTPVVYIFRYISPSVLNSLETGYLTTERHNNHQLYQRAHKLLGSNVFTQSTVVSLDRSESGVSLVVQTPSGRRRIQAKRILSTIPPVLNNLNGFDLSAEERSIFGQFKAHGYYTSILKDTGLPDGIVIEDVGQGRPYDFPTQPGILSVVYTGFTGIFNVFYGTFSSETPLAEVKQGILDGVTRLAKGGLINGTSDPKFVDFRSHAPYELEVSPDAVKKGFYRSLYGLQGKKSTFWTGAAFLGHDSAGCWNFTEYLLPSVIKGL